MSNWASGHNTPGYLPEADPYVSSDHESAKRFLIGEVERAADDADAVGDHGIAEDLSAAAEELNLVRFVCQDTALAEWGATIDGVAYWLNSTDEDAS
jgi:hypothetical protein